MDLPHLLRRAARETPEAVAISDGVRSLRTGALLEAAERLANFLDASGVAAGSCIGVLSENRTEYLVADCAIALGRYVRVALNTRLNLEDHRYVAQDTDMRVLIHSKEHSEEADALGREYSLLTLALDDGDEVSPWWNRAARNASARSVIRVGSPSDPAWINYTSGTTGRPKGVVLSHEALCQVSFNLLLELGHVIPGEQMVLTQPLSHGAGYFPLPYLMSGAGVRTQKRFDPDEVWELGRRPEHRTVKVIPAMLPRVMEASAGHWGFDSIMYGASPISTPVLDASIERFGLSLIQIYGKTEAPATLTCLQKADHVGESRHSAGRPWRTVEIEIRNADGGSCETGQAGELFVRGPHLMNGYRNNPAATDEVLVDGWLATADLAVLDERGFVHLRGRMDEVIITGGFNVAPKEVEEVLVTFEGIQEAVVVGLADTKWGSAVCAVLRAEEPRGVDLDAVMTFARDRLGYRAPKQVVLTAEIPRTAYGKVDRQAIVQLFESANQEASDV